ncbi:MAG: Uncharacterised protein [Bacteroidota bacterium]|nr:MAG: Uncharacterised protein [Bacteroidota bacterium]
MRTNILLLILGFHAMVWAQPVRVDLTVNTELVNQTNIAPVKTLEKSLRDFLNNTKWTSENGNEQAEVSISMLLTISNINDNSYGATLQVQSGRLVFNSSYTSPLVTFLDDNFNFTYQEFQPFYFDVNRYNNNLVSVFSYYIYMAIGMELDSFSPLGGTSFFERARTIANAAQASNAQGWAVSQNRNGRYELIDQIISPAFNDFRNVIYQYHRNGLDNMVSAPEEAKTLLKDELLSLQKLMQRQPNSYLMRAFFDAKGEEIGQLFSDGPEVETDELLRFLNRFAPSNSQFWALISR